MGMRLIYLDSGHGGLIPKTDLPPVLRYTTAPDKMYKHARGQFHGDGYFFEGVANRQISDLIAARLTADRLPFLRTIDPVRPWADRSLVRRIIDVNRAARMPETDVLFISNHCNAAPIPGSASGFEIYTSPGDTASDKYADEYFSRAGYLGKWGLRRRVDLSDGDHDKEARFHVLMYTKCPALLIEHGFFDHEHDAGLLINPRFLNDTADAQFEFLRDWVKGMF